MQPPLLSACDRRALSLALDEDIGPGDLSGGLLDDATDARFVIRTREDVTACGLFLAAETLSALCPAHSFRLSVRTREGERAHAGAILLEGVAPARALLAAERVMLNMIRLLSATATETAEWVRLLAGSQVRLLDTRKTLPGLRGLQKYAVRCGGGYNHRFGLFDGVMLKDNHIAMFGSVTAAVKAARERLPALTKIEVECDTAEQVAEALDAAPDMIMLDNMDDEMIRWALRLRASRWLTMPFEVSGNVTAARLPRLAKLGPEYVSAGRITWSPKPVDIGLDIE